MLHKILGGLFVFGLVPLGLGTVWTKGMEQKKDKLAHIYLAGFLSELAIFQVIAVPVMLTQPYGMEFLVKLATAVLALFSAAGLVWTAVREKAFFKKGVCIREALKKGERRISKECVLFGYCLRQRSCFSFIWRTAMLILTGTMLIMWWNRCWRTRPAY